MNETVKIAISLPRHLLEQIDRRLGAHRGSRSRFFRDAVEEKLLREDTESARQRYVAGYERDPETADEVDAARLAASSLLAREPWA
jgi:metal-responsive CopG/Arc/MetJ family transcriptional regulator